MIQRNTSVVAIVFENAKGAWGWPEGAIKSWGWTESSAPLYLKGLQTGHADGQVQAEFA